jgi:superfamily II DNA or RNA helicase
VTLLRPYQREAVAAVENDLPSWRRVLVVMPTGTGKTITFAENIRLAVERGERVLVLAHRRELIEQTVRKLRDLGIAAGVERGPQRSHGEPVIVASVQTAQGDRLATFGRFDLVVVDECHHAPSESYKRILARFPGVRVLGVTATPDRLDGVGMCEVFEHVSYHMTIRRATDEGWLVPIRAVQVQVRDMDLSHVRERRGDLHAGDLHAAVMPAVDGVVEPLLRLAGTRRTVVFAVDVGHAQAIAEAINHHRPGSAQSVDGSMPDRSRSELIKKFSAGEFQFLVNCQLLVEGWDDPAIECVAMARPTESRGWYTQAVGRGLRLSPGKEECLLLDFVGVGMRLSLASPQDILGKVGVVGKVTSAGKWESGDRVIHTMISEWNTQQRQSSRSPVQDSGFRPENPLVRAGRWLWNLL